ncbi:unnamed protein product [Notodromas monacha]|uniref:Crooked neck protein n=1 Tax=Notodromas monacha TaxID=399045 RepID=A0A7R9BMC3_9CRUS|nr:unnamed protein product [Notodromas monacha]CAG0917317.1 unnamed protein product [Notodromas monacha]
MEAAAPGKPQKLPKVAKVKNKAPNEIQITAEQLLREAKERDLEIVAPPPRQKIADAVELADYRLRKRKTFEDNLRKNRLMISNWIKYALWEESQKEVQRARSIFERALDVDHRNITLWLKYAEMEMRNKQVNHARNIWDRAVTILPRANQFWYKYTYMEEMLGNVAGARAVFERWMEWQPDEQAWMTYVKFELRYSERERARDIYDRFVMTHPEPKNWIRFAKFEADGGNSSAARQLFERAVEFFGEDFLNDKLFIAFARFEESQREHDRARVIYKYALDHLPKEQCEEVYKSYTIHEKKYGDRSGIEDVIVSKRKFQYEEEVKANPLNYDAWFDYLRLVESEGDVETIRDTYERAIANVPPIQQKRYWRRYIYLWINYALREEMKNKDIERTRQVYKACLDLLPHKNFTFSKIWLLFAYFEIRQKELQAARKILGRGIGMCPREKLFRGYIDLEIQLREFDRCRILYEKFLEFDSANCSTWMKFAELELLLGDVDRARAIFELAIHQDVLDIPEVLWKAYIDFEINQEDHTRVRRLYRKLLEKTSHVKACINFHARLRYYFRVRVWVSFARFEAEATGPEGARKLFREANNYLRDEGREKEDRLHLLEGWKSFEEELGDDGEMDKVKALMPKRVKKQRRTQNDQGMDTGWEEYYDYIFPEDEASRPNLKLLAMAKMWKQTKGNLPESTEISNETSRDEEVSEPGVADSGEIPISGSESESEEDQEEEESSRAGKRLKTNDDHNSNSDKDDMSQSPKPS